MAARRPRRKSDGTVELPESRCPLCGTNNLGTNVTKGAWFCWKCWRGGYLTLGEKGGLDSAATSPDPANKQHSEVAATLALPDMARKAIEARGADPEWLEKRYGVLWTGDRLHWPAGDGGSLPAVWAWPGAKTPTGSA